MDNIFSILNKEIGTASPKQPQAAEPKPAPKQAPETPASLSNRDVVMAWQKNPSPELTSEVLRRMKKTMTAAIRSYAPDMGDKLSVRAAKLTLEALKTYDPSFGSDPSTHVFNNLKRLGRIGARRGNIIPQPEAFMLEAKRAEDAKARFEDEKGREPSLQELADITGFSAKKLDRLLNRGTVVSESSTLTDDNRHDTFASSDLTDDDYFEYVYASVGPIDQKVMEWSSGMHGKKVLSNNEMATRLKVSPAAVSQRRAKLQNMLSEMRTLA